MTDINSETELLRSLKERTVQLRAEADTLAQNRMKRAHSRTAAETQLQSLSNELQVQSRKAKTLFALVLDLSLQKQDAAVCLPECPNDNSLQRELVLLRKLLIKTGEENAGNIRLLGVLEGKVKESNKALYLEEQTQLNAKLTAQIRALANTNSECGRKWSDLQSQSKWAKQEQGLLNIQLERLRTEVKQHHEQYMERLMESKSKLVQFHQTQRDTILTDHLVESTVLAQQKRLEAQQNLSSLRHHREALAEEADRLAMENRELRSFFAPQEGKQGGKLATQMRARVEELRDSIREREKITRMDYGLDEIRRRQGELRDACQYGERRVGQSRASKGSVLQKAEVVGYFERVLKQRNEERDNLREILSNLKVAGKQMTRKVNLNEESIRNYEQQLKMY